MTQYNVILGRSLPIGQGIENIPTTLRIRKPADRMAAWKALRKAVARKHRGYYLARWSPVAA